MLRINKRKQIGRGTPTSRTMIVASFSVAVLLSVAIITRSTFLSSTTIGRDLAILPPLIELQNAPTHICFISSQFASSVSETDRLFDVRKTVPNMVQSPYFHFFAFSNLADLKAPGWEVIVKDLRQYSRWITHSRWPKFQAFRDPVIQQRCQVVFYVDGIISPKDIVDDFQAEARKILNSPVQLAQRLHGDGGGAGAEFKRIKKQKKDIKPNIQASLQWLQSQPDYDKNCTLYENNMFGYSIHSEAFQKAANFFWDHYSLEQDSWRDQPLWCYTLDHFNITPLQLTGNGKGTLFDKTLKRMRRGGHRYKTEASISASAFYAALTNQTFNGMLSPPTPPHPATPSCWLNVHTAGAEESNKLKSIPNITTGDNSIHLIPICPDAYRSSMAPDTRTQPGITIGIPYYASPAMMLQQLDNFANYPIDLQQQLTIIIVDDGSPMGLQAGEYCPEDTSSYHFRLRIAQITSDIAWNVEGSRNLAFYLADTQRGLMLDSDMLLPQETLKAALQWNTTKVGNATHPETIAMAHKFNRRKPNGRESVQPALAVLDIPEYWNAGGLDEDFAGRYGYGTEPHFWHQWKKGTRDTESHRDTFVLELETNACDSKWLKDQEAVDKCKVARLQLPKLDRDKKPNRALWRKKKKKGSWSNSYLRFNWTMDR